jgi:hypothetical protein
VTRKRLVWLLLAAAALAVWWRGRPRGEALPGDLAAIDWRRDPLQSETDRAPFEIASRKGGVTLAPRATYEISAVVESTERYWFDPPAVVSPLDVALAWGEIPTPAYRDRLSISQSWRFVFWRSDDPALDTGYVIAHAANTHTIPANPNVRRALLALDRGDEVRLSGLLVDVAAPGFTWGTSLVRTDHGDQGCEILYVESVVADGRVYR